MSVGHVYVIAFSNGIIKVGRTMEPARRLSVLRQTARNFNLAVIREWVSPPHECWMDNERALVASALILGGKTSTAEYYTEVDFDALVGRACRLSFPAPGPGELGELDGTAIRRARTRKSLTRAEVAKRCTECGVSVGYAHLARIEVGTIKRPPLELILAIAEVLDMETDDMFVGANAA